MSAPELHVIHTPCRDCVFARYQQTEDGRPSQVDCQLKKLDKFKERSGEDAIVPAQDPDGKVEFYVVNGRKCHFHRNRESDWAKLRAPEDYALAVRKEVAMRVSVVFVIRFEDNDLEDVKSRLLRSLDSLRAQHVSPSQVFIINNSETIKNSKVIVFLNKHGDGLNWNAVDIVQRSHTDRPDFVFADEVLNQLKAHYYAFFDLGFEVPADFIASIDRLINDELEQLFLLKPVEGTNNGLTVHLGFHKTYDGNNYGYGDDLTKPQFKFEQLVDVPSEPTYPRILLENIVQKAEFFSKVNNQHTMVRSVSEVCPSLSQK